MKKEKQEKKTWITPELIQEEVSKTLGGHFTTGTEALPSYHT